MTIRCCRCSTPVKITSGQRYGVPGWWCRSREGSYKLCSPCMVACYPQAFQPQVTA